MSYLANLSVCRSSILVVLQNSDFGLKANGSFRVSKRDDRHWVEGDLSSTPLF